MSRDLFHPGDNETAHTKEAVRSDLVDIDLLYAGQSPLALSVKKEGAAGPWIWLPKSQIEFEMKSKGVVHVTLPEWLAKEKGLL